MKNAFLLFLLTALLSIFSACRHTANESVQSAEDNAQIETEYSQIYDVVADLVASDYHTAKTDDYLLPGGATVTFSDTTFDDGDGVDFTINYGPLNNGSGTKGIVCRDGRYRAGAIHVGMDKRWSEIPCVVTIAISAADEYYTGNGTKMYKLTGTKTISRTTSTTYTVNVSDATLQRDNGTVSWNAQRNITLTNDAPLGWLNDEYQVTGTSSGINANGETFTVQTTVPLQKRLTAGCMSAFVAGELTLTTGNGKTLVLNYDPYGNQACDKTATVLYNGHTYTINLW